MEITLLGLIVSIFIFYLVVNLKTLNNLQQELTETKRLLLITRTEYLLKKPISSTKGETTCLF